MNYLDIEFTRINNCVNGNPRYVCHFLDLLKDGETSYQTAINNAKEIGGKKYHTKSYGGGIVFSSYNLRDEAEKIALLTGKAVKAHRPPNAYELKMGYGATHYRVFLKSEVLNKLGKVKAWFKANDGLNYSTK